MFKIKNYKKLYEIELNNRKLYEARKKELSEENIKLQKMVITNEKQIKTLKEENTSLKIQLDDSMGFLMQEKACSEALRRERKNLKTKLTKCINALAEHNLDEALKFSKSLGEKKNGSKND